MKFNFMFLSIVLLFCRTHAWLCTQRIKCPKARVRLWSSWLKWVSFHHRPDLLVLPEMHLDWNYWSDPLSTEVPISVVYWENFCFMSVFLIITHCLWMLMGPCFSRFSKAQRRPVWLQSFESVTYSTDFTVSSARKLNCQIQVSLLKK